ncbi:MAG: hypothetical protein PHH24_00570 [Candidatus Moranbacteria bacterium]|nr:hypothetical protein [Candidatus Moranbacteria bacterium]MDD5652211.1 hypothetical protein [Candidatus Moranbacteria bacterium]MDX9855754.1 hypothetical protein [Candidatus Moranbacteria bacterium]
MKKIILAIIIVALFAGLSFSAKADVIGWLWGGGTESFVGDTSHTNFGWISANSSNCASNEGELTETAFCPQATGASYSLAVPSTDGPVSGYVWSENVGWISFNSGDLTGCPSGECSARRAGGWLEGWARIKSIQTAYALENSGGWEGWISLKGTGYGVEISKMDGNLNTPTYAWSDELGWINFGGAMMGKTLKVCYNSCDSTLQVSNFNLPINNTKEDIKACYGMDPGCNDSDPLADVTSVAAWSGSDSPNNSVSLSGTDNITVHADSLGTETVLASYLGSSASFDVTVFQVCSYYGCGSGSQANDCVQNPNLCVIDDPSETCATDCPNMPLADPCIQVEENSTKCGGTGVDPTNWIETN